MKWAPQGVGARGAGPISGERLAAGILLCASLVPIIASQFCQVSLPKLGLVRATWFQTSGQPQVPLAGFLGLPYAAPPIGPLRFMPPGAPTRGPRNNGQLEWHQLAESGQRVEVRSHDRFGPACVNLPDWLPNEDTAKRRSQSEDCLLANVFVQVPEARWRDYTATIRQPPVNQTNQVSRLWPLPLPVATKRLPVLVLVQGEPSSPQNMSLPYLELARRAILVTFGYRQALLGFLPLSGADSAPEVTRSNHAIWDQVALLHWLKHNVIHFGGDPANISLKALDNKAGQLLQWLALSPMAKGLFRRLILVRNERFSPVEPPLATQLGIGSGLSMVEVRDSRLRLNSALKQALTQIQAGPIKEILSRDIVGSLQTANLTQLAQLDSQLKQILPVKVLALALGPSLDDKHLFPYSSTLAKQLELFPHHPITTSNINYLAYVRHLRAHSSDDQLGLLQTGKAHLNNSNATLGGWYHSSSNLSSSSINEEQEEHESSATSRQRENIATIANHFEHLRSLNLLVRLLTSTSHSEKSSSSNYSPVHYQPEVSNSTHLCNNSKEITTLDAQFASFDLLMGNYVSGNSDSPEEQPLFNGTFNNIIKVLLENSTTFRREMLIWIKFSDLHSIANLKATCDSSSDPESSNRPSSTFVFFNQQVVSENGSTSSWLIDALGHQSLLSSIQSFIESGNTGTNEWPPYTSLKREVGKFEIKDEEMSSLRNEATLFLDVIPYLCQPLQAWRDHEDLYSCLTQFNTTIGTNKPNPTEIQVPKCLLSKMDRLRATIRQLAHHDLEPIQQLLKSHQETTMSARNVAADDNLLIDQEVVNSDSSSVNIIMESSDLLQRAKSKHLLRNDVDGELDGLVTGAISFVKHRPLLVVVTTGLVIFFINLTIVLVIAVRTRKKRQVVDSAASQPEISIQLPNQKPSTGAAPKRLTFDLPEESNSDMYNTQLMLLEPPVLRNHVPVHDHEPFLIESSFTSQSTYSNNSQITNGRAPQTLSANILGPIFQSPCTSNTDTCTLTPIQNSLFEANAPYQRGLLSNSQFVNNELSEMLLCTPSEKSPANQQNSTDLLILTPYPNHYFMNHEV